MKLISQSGRGAMSLPAVAGVWLQSGLECCGGNGWMLSLRVQVYANTCLPLRG